MNRDEKEEIAHATMFSSHLLQMRCNASVSCIGYIVKRVKCTKTELFFNKSTFIIFILIAIV